MDNKYDIGSTGGSPEPAVKMEASQNKPTGTEESEPQPPRFEYTSLEAVRKKLLDLTGRNQLLNYKHPKASCVRLIDELPDQIYEQLQNGKVFNFIPVPDPTEKQLLAEGYLREDPEEGLVEVKPYPTAEQWAKYHNLNTSYELPDPQSAAGGEKRHSDLDIQALMYASELEARLRTIRGKAETAVEESGTNILYLVLGFLEWYETPESDVKRLAPLFTLPVRLDRAQLDRSQGVFRYAISLKDEGMLTNITLKEKLANDFNLVLPEIDEESTPEAYFREITNTLLKHQPRWKLRRMATLAMLNFAKQVMYEDLNPESWPKHSRIEDHPIINRFFSSQQKGGEQETPQTVEEYPIDEIEGVHEQFPLIDRADSSQHSALIDAVKGECLVIEGPPGSGKSQTITNLIAACIANGKRVLFVAEKMAALSVVKSRLDRAGLGDFCLELHSHKTNKQRLLTDLKYRLDRQGNYRSPEEIDADIARYEDLKSKLNNYVRVINSRWKNTGLTIHQIFQSATRYREELQLDPDPLFIENATGDVLTLVRRKEMTDHAEMLVKAFYLVQEQAEDGVISNHHWFGVNNAELMAHHLNEVVAKLAEWTGSLDSVRQLVDSLVQQYGIDAGLLAHIGDINLFKEAVGALPELLGGEPLKLLPDVAESIDELNELLDRYERLHGELEKLLGIFSQEAVTNTDVPALIMVAIKKCKSFGVMEAETLGQLHSDFNAIKQADQKAQAVGTQLAAIAQSLPDNLKALCTGSAEALKELNIFIKLVKQLPPELWRHRDDVYDSSEMDDLLSQMTSRFRDLLPVHKSLGEDFRLAELPPAKTMTEWRDLIQNGGLFAFLSRQWWQARRQVFALATSIKPNKKQLLTLLPKLVEYKKRLEEIDGLNKDANILGAIYQGMDTPLDRVTALRAWYRAVRDEYGRGLVPRAKLGDRLLALDRNLAMAMADLDKSGLTQSIDEVLATLQQAKQRYSQYAPLVENNAVLTNADSSLRKLAVDLQKLLKVLLGHIKNGSHTLASSANAAVTLNKYQKATAEWRDHDLTQKITAELPLEIAPGKFNAKALSVAKNFARIGQACTESSAVYRVLVNQPNGERYNHLKGQYGELEQRLTEERQKWTAFQAVGKVNEDEWQQSSEGNLEQLISRNRRALANPKWLSTWLDFIRLRKRLTNDGVQRILQKLESGELQAKDFCTVVQMVLAHQLAVEVLMQQPELSDFTGVEQMAIREKYCDYDRRLMELQRQKVAYRAAQTSPPLGNGSGKVSTYTEICLIKHEAGKRTRHIAVRTLVERAGKAIQTLKPCFMMSPMSVAQYLPPGAFEFDVVVMDEASQIRPEDALGTIARGKSIVVVGDPKQLPPTSFFDKMIDDQFNEDTTSAEESESILESAIPMFKTRRLRWHYRSRHESLIAFSNLHYYHSDLVIFPSPYSTSPEFGVRYHRVSRGRFAGGKNAEEAKVIAKAALEHMSTRPDESVGLVAMNAAQRGEIEMHLEELIKENPQFQAALEQNAQLEERLFVKNLENVQGDERDVIMISMTYGPDEVGGKVYQRFGPINMDVGWRRLNVLFTRSKKRMHIFSSMRSSDILVSGSSKRGVQSLRAFLEYCETGHLHSALQTGKEPDSDFEIAVARALLNHGYECEPQVGVAGYYLDLAVRDPDRPGRYMMGIECDGASYHSAKSARDRDRLRQEILESLGWRIRRVWSTDWFKNPEAQLQPILNELTELKAEAQSELSHDTVAEPEELLELDTVDASEIIQEFEEGANVDSQVDDDVSLRSKLVQFDQNVIRGEFPETNEQNRLLRPAMLEALLHHLPTSKEEFSLVIPSYIRVGTDVQEAQKHLEAVLEIIADYGEFSDTYGVAESDRT